MGIPNFPPPAGEPHLRGFQDGLAAGELRLTIDPRTGAHVWYPPEVVPGDPGAVPAWRRVSAEGTAYSFTTVARCLLPGDQTGVAPYTVVLFEPDEAPGCRVPALLVDAGDVAPRCGMRLTFRPIAVGDHHIAGVVPAATE